MKRTITSPALTAADYAAAETHCKRRPGFKALPRHEQAQEIAHLAVARAEADRPGQAPPRTDGTCCEKATRIAERFGLGRHGIARLREERPHTPEAIEAADEARRRHPVADGDIP